VVVGDWVVVVLAAVVDVVLEGSSVAVTITQYDLLVSRFGQVIPGFSCWRVLTESAQLLAKLVYVAPASAVVEKSQSTARRVRTAAMAGTTPTTRRVVRCIILDLCWDYAENGKRQQRFAA
jgi:hypothetical protein